MSFYRTVNVAGVWASLRQWGDLQGINLITAQLQKNLLRSMGDSLISQHQSQLDIAAVCDEVKELLLEKNFKYGDAALRPARIFSRADTAEQLNVRIDDKLNRIANRKDNEDEDPEWDLLGYLILKRVEKMQRERRSH